MNQVQNISFYGQTVPVFTQKKNQYVAMKPICENIGIDWEAQRQKIQRNQILNSTACMIKAVAPDGKLREMLCLPIDYLNGWLFGVDAARVKPEIRERLLTYQRECYRVLNAHFNPPPRALPTAENRDAWSEMFKLLSGLETALSNAYCSANLDDYIRAVTGKRRFDLDFYQLSALLQKLIAELPRRVIEQSPEVKKLRMANRYDFTRDGSPPLPAPEKTKADIVREHLSFGCHSHIGTLILKAFSDINPAEKRQIIEAAMEEMDNLLHVNVTAAENYDYNDENRNLGKSELDTAVYELVKLQRLVSDLAQSW